MISTLFAKMPKGQHVDHKWTNNYPKNTNNGPKWTRMDTNEPTWTKITKKYRNIPKKIPTNYHHGPKKDKNRPKVDQQM